ncbi:MAG: bifunctional riboflavin kinase/FAD synthetase [Chloroflexi bacterium]|nr:MAG: bifunctional riboflavin kinase/FAD synthetase [Chloroflexota bacterium]TMC33540.1 MAG: bifunctional riboflavin kinase/FAD synthetase [Chloroflexota bacterium]
MSVSRDFAGWPKGPLHLAIGVFDGVHIGHQTLMRDAARRARNEGATPVAATFDPLPIEVLAPGAPPSALSDIDERCTALERFGAQHIVVFTFTPEFAALTPEEFVERLVGAGDLRRVCVGEDFQFGRDRAGDVRRLAELGKTHGFVCDLAKPVTLDGQVVSSTGIRNALLAGDVENAGRLLGRPYAVTGVVEHGSKRGRALGFPTMNLGVAPNRLLPRDGIYAVWAEVEGKRVKAAASLGVRPTFGGGERMLEAYLLDWSGEIYGDRVRCEFVRRLRDELRFASATELAAQIARDVEQTRDALR